MWTCDELKKSAWKNLSPNYWWAVLLVFLYTAIVSTASSIVSGITSISSPIISIIFSSSSVRIDSNTSFYEAMRILGPALIASLVITSVACVFAYAVAIFVSNPLYCGVYQWFITEREQKRMHSITDLFVCFRKGVYKHLVSGMAWRVLWTSLWSLVAIIPLLIPTAISILFGLYADNYADRVSANFGITNSAAWAVIIISLVFLYTVAALISIMITLNRYYSYFYVPFILLDDPDIGCRKALKRSLLMSKGQKAKMFVLDLSFIGWWLLVFLSCGFFAVALQPYLFATYTELYFFRKNEMDAGSVGNASQESVAKESIESNL